MILCDKKIDLSVIEERRRLDHSARKALGNIAHEWSLSDQQTAGLIGIPTNDLADFMKPSYGEPMTEGAMTRIGLMIGIYESLHTLYGLRLANDWPKLRNRGPLYETRSPLETMIEGGEPQMRKVRGQLDGLTGGSILDIPRRSSRFAAQLDI